MRRTGGEAGGERRAGGRGKGVEEESDGEQEGEGRGGGAQVGLRVYSHHRTHAAVLKVQAPRCRLPPLRGGAGAAQQKMGGRRRPPNSPPAERIRGAHQTN